MNPLDLPCGSPALFEAILERLPVGVMTINSTGDITFVNPSFCSMFDFSREFVLMKGWSEVFSLDDSNNDFHQVILELIQGELPLLERIVEYEMPDDSILNIGITSSFLKKGSDISGLILIFQDMSIVRMRHGIEKEEIQEIAKLNRDREMSLFNLSNAVAHQVKNPATIIGGMASQLIRTFDAKDKKYEKLNIILHESKKLEVVVKEVYKYVSLKVSHVKWHPFNTLLQEWVEEQKRVRSVSIDVRCPEASFWGDSYLVHQVLSELLRNTEDFTSNSRTPAVTISGELTPKYFCIYYADTSDGISDDLQPYIFNPFFTTKAQGVGMGLSIVKRCLQLHGGRVAFDSLPGQGVRFRLKFPVGPKFETE